MKNSENTARRQSKNITLSGIFSEGYGVIPKRLMRAQDIGPYEKLIIAYMLSYTGGGNTCFPSYAAMEHDLQISRPTIAKALKRLKARGYIKKTKLFPDSPLKHNSKYTLQFIESPIVNEINKGSKRRELSRLTSLTRNNNTYNNKGANAEKKKSIYPDMRPMNEG